ncbi:MAG: ABC transporter permease subunit [Planctomycetota bacterium]
MAEIVREARLGKPGQVALGGLALGGLAWISLGLTLPLPSQGGLRVAGDLLTASLRPALDYQSAPPGGASIGFVERLGQSTLLTLAYALAASLLAVPLGLALGCLASEALREHTGSARALRRMAVLTALGLRSVHSLLWAVLLLVALGLGPGTAIAALLLPLVGTLGKVFAELIDESDPRGASGLAAAGARPLAVFLFGRIPAALPNLVGFAFYRFECTVRTAAVLGFFGFPTLGYHLQAAFEESHYHEVWTYLYALIALSLLLEAWSAALRWRVSA